MRCGGPYTTNACRFNCVAAPDLCGPGETCKTEVYGKQTYWTCVAPPPPPPNPCTTPTTTASSGVGGTKTIGELSDTEKGLLCDWQAGRAGGYGCTRTCDGGVSTTNKANRAACTTSLKATCPATVAEAEACIAAIANDPCNLGVALAPVCQPFFQAGCK
ncbi:hypothetical protein BH11MYX4_BH11MYX4_15550 [soil metagenome]